MNKDTLFYLIYPALVAVVSAVFSFFGSYRLQKNEKQRERNISKGDFIEKMLIFLERLNIIIEKLSDDPTKHNYFSLQTIATIRPLIARTQLIIEDKLSLFEDQIFRSNVINTLDGVSAIVDEIASEESNPVNKYNEHNATVKETVAEYNTFKIKILEMGFYLDTNNDPQDIDILTAQNYQNLEKKKQIGTIIQGFNSKINDSQKQLDAINQQTKEHRAFLAVKLLNAQSKVKDLCAELVRQKVKNQSH